ncbi:MAG: hypothetical protein JWO78_1204 [Micavibrio sp.]|nr:hypothetical protein [Micavibrio sp.]
MPAQLSRKGLKPSLVALGLSLATFATVFNAQAAGTEQSQSAEPFATANIPRPVSAATEQFDQKLKDALNETGEILSARIKGDDFNPVKDQDIQNRVNTIKALIESGANPNHYVPDTLSMQPDRNMSPLGAAIMIAAKARRPDLVQSFIDKGADVRLRTDRGWGAMDYAIVALIQAQENPKNFAPSMVEVENAVKILKILNTAGLRPTDATMLTNNSTARTQNYATLATRQKKDPILKINGFVLRHILHQQGLLTNAEFEEEIKGDRTNAALLLNEHGITDKNLTANDGNVGDSHNDIIPGGYKTLRVLKGSTIMTLATNFAGAMGAATPQEAFALLAAKNGLTLSMAEASEPLAAARDFMVPISPANLFGETLANADESVREIALRVKDIYYKKNASVAEIAADIARMNGVNADALDDKTVFDKDARVIIVFMNDSHSHLSEMTPPAGAPAGRKVDLVLVESSTSNNAEQDGVQHSRETTAVAASTGYAINHRADFSRIHRLDESLTYFPAGDTPKGASNALKILMNPGNTSLRDRLIFSVSEAQTTTWGNATLMSSVLTQDNIAYEGIRLMLPNMDQAKPTIFLGAANRRATEGPYIQSHTTVNSPRATLLGATGKYTVAPATGGMATVIAPYSSYGADVCVPLPVKLKKQFEGSSISAPVMASIARQFNEWYGNRLSFEEIKAAALMTADRDIQDADDPQRMESIILGKGGEANREEIKTHTAKFNSNGGGLPHNTYCGAGTINAVRWKKNVDTLLTLKQPGQDAEGSAVTLQAGAPEVSETLSNGKKEYTYRLRVPQYMTLGRLTFLLPQEREQHGEVVVKTPAGFEMQLPHALTNIVSTDAFSYEDVKAGDIIEIRTNHPLGETGGLVLRGHAPGNAIAMLRDKLQTEGVLPAPVKEMEGNRVVGPSKPVTVLRDAKVTYPGFGRD